MADVVGVLADEMTSLNSKSTEGVRRMSLMADIRQATPPLAYAAPTAAPTAGA
jgi:hypothetical protein